MNRMHGTLLMLLAAASMLTAAPPARAAGLEAFRSKTELILVFAPRHGDRRMIEQLVNLKGLADKLAERGMPVFVVTGTDAAALVGMSADIRPDGRELRKTYGVADDAFAIVLVGKDGEEKLQLDQPAPADRIARAIDETSVGENDAQ